MEAPKADGDKWVDWQYVKGRAALKPVKALKIRALLEPSINVEQYWPVKFKYFYQSATSGRKPPKPRQDLRVLKREQDAQRAVRKAAREAASILPSVEDECDSISPPCKKRKRRGEHVQRKRPETDQERKKRKRKQIYLSPYWKWFEDRGGHYAEALGEPKPQYDPVTEAAREKVLAGTGAPDYSHVIDKDSDDDISWVDSEEEPDTSDSEDEDRGCYNNHPTPFKVDPGYETERIPTPEMDEIIAQHSQEWHSPAARAERRAIIEQWAEEDANGIFFGKPIRRSPQGPVTPTDEITLDTAVSIESG